MKKVLLTIACAICALTVSAQRASSSSSSLFSTEKSEQSITVGVRAGVNFSNFGGDTDGWDSRTGFNIGVNVDIPLMQSLYLQTGLFATQKGAKNSGKANPLYLQIPILASYRYNLSDAAQLQVNFGPYLAYGISGKFKGYNMDDIFDDSFDDEILDLWANYDDYIQDIADMLEEKSEIDFFGDDEDQFGGKRFEVGLQVGAGVTINKFYVGCAYEFGLTNAYENKIWGKGKNRNFMVNIGYNF